MQRPAADVNSRIPMLLIAALVWLGVADLPTRVPLGPLSLSGAATLAVGVATIVLAPMVVLHGRSRRTPRTWAYVIPPGPRRSVVPLALVLFCVVAVIRTVAAPTQSGVQQTSVYLGFAGAVAAGALWSRPETAARFLHLLGRSMCIVGLIAVPAFLLGLPLWGARSYALAALVAVAVLVPVASRHPKVRFAPYALTLGIAASLSRTALAIAVLLLAFAVLRSRHGLRGPRVVLALLGLAAAGVVAFLTIPSLRDRFLVGDNSLQIGGVALNTSGRTQIWTVVVEDTLPATWFGRGAGTASDLLAARYPDIAQPHNDFLRIWHDFGLVGLALFVAGTAALVLGAATRLRRADPADRGIHWAALLGLGAIGAAALTDNPIIYPFVMLPLGVVVGLSIGLRGQHADGEPSAARPARHPGRAVPPRTSTPAHDQETGRVTDSATTR